MTLYIGIGIAIVLSFFALIIYNNCVKYNIQKIKLIETIDNIKILLEKKLDTLIKFQKDINKTSNEKILEKIPKIAKKTLDIFEFDNELTLAYKDIKQLLEDNKNIILDEYQKNLINELNSNDIEIKGLKIYYNDIANIFNKMIKRFPSNIIKIFKHYQEQELYILEKEVDFEILKRK